MPTIQVNDIRIFYTVQGQGKPLIMLHGNGSSQKTFKGVVDELSTKYQVYLTDARWQGKTSKGTKQLTYPLLTDDLRGFVNALNINNPYIVGFSDGGIVALDYCARYGNCSKVIAYGANFYADALDQPSQEYFGKLIKKCSKMQFLPWRKHTYQLINLMMDQSKYPDIEELSNITCPALIMVGDQDCINSLHTNLIASLIPDSQLRVIPDCGHSIHKHQRQAFLDTLFDFLD